MSAHSPLFIQTRKTRFDVRSERPLSGKLTLSVIKDHADFATDNHNMQQLWQLQTARTVCRGDPRIPAGSEKPLGGKLSLIGLFQKLPHLVGRFRRFQKPRKTIVVKLSRDVFQSSQV